MWTLAYFAVFAATANSTECEWESSAEATASSADFDTAVRNSQDSVTLYLAEDTQPYKLLSALEVNICLAIRGNRQTALLGQRITVTLELRILNATLKNERVDLEALVDIRGTVVIEHCSIEGFSIPFFQVLGKLRVFSSTVNQSSEAIITLFASSSVSLATVNVDSHVGAFLTCDSKLEAVVRVSISACTFRNCVSRNSESLLQLLGFSARGALSLVSSHFRNNSSPLVYFDVHQFQAEFANCSFTFNSNTGVAGLVESTLLEMRNCVWSDNSGILIDMMRLQGNFTVVNCAVSHQIKKGAFQVVGSSSADCQFSIIGSRLFNSTIVASGYTPGALLAYFCSATVSNTSIEGFTITAPKVMQAKGLIFFQFCSLFARDLLVSRSGTSDMSFAGMYSYLQVSNATLYLPISGQNIVFGLTQGNMLVNGLAIIDQESKDFGRPSLTSSVPTLIALMSTSCTLSDIHIVQSVKRRYNLPMLVGYSVFNFSRIEVRGQDFGSVISLDSSSGTFSDFLLENSFIDGNIVCALRGTEMRIANFTISRTVIDSVSILSLSSNCSLSATNLTFAGVTATQLVSAKNSIFRGTNVRITQTVLSFLVQYGYGSQLSFANLSVAQSRLSMFSIVQSNVTLSNCSFQDVRGDAVLFQAQVSSVSILSCSFRNVSSREKLGKFYESSSLSIVQSSFHNITADGEGFRVTEGSLFISSSQFAQYSAALFQAASSTVTIHDSSFRDGVNGILSLISNAAYGGVLGCASCSAIDIRRTAVFNVTAAAGGAIAVRLTDTTLTSTVFLENSKFINCRAKTGGAVYIQNSSATISSSYFAGNSAQGHGGALFVDIRTIDSNSVTNCTFEVNSAREGGAIKWRNAPVYTKKCRYVNNSARYGSDIASYGVELSSLLTNVSQVYVSGSKLTVTFELLDHYGNRVRTATNQYLSLLSTNVHYRGNSVSFINEGIFHFPELTVYALPNSTQTITGEMNDTQGDFRINVIGTVKLTFRDCEAGEIRRADRCEYCYSGTLSYSPLDSNCTYCPPNAFCPGGPHLTLDSGFWRSSMNTTTLLRCPLEDNCEGSEFSNCSEGYSGLLCNQCANGFYRFRTVECESCLNIAAVWVQVLIPIVLIAFFGYVLIRYSHSSKESERFILKTSIHHSQFLAAMCPLKVSLPPILKNSLHALTYVSSLQISDLPLACFGLTSPELVRALIASLLLPTLVVISFIVNYLFKIEWKKRTFVFSSTLLLFTPPIVVNSAISLLVCQSVDSSEEWLFLDMSQQCWAHSHKLIIFALVTPSLILNTIVPMAAVTIIALLRPAIFDEYFPVWRSGYRYRCWDLLFVVSKAVCFGLLTISMSENKLSQLTYGLLVFIVISVINVSSVDLVYSTHRFFYVAETSLVIASVSMGLYTPYTYSIPEPAARDYFLSAVFLLLNCGFFTICAVLPASVLLKTERTESKAEISPPHNSIASSEQSFSISS